MIAWRAVNGPVEVCFTDRRDGLSRAPFDGFNLGDHVGDDPQVVATHRRQLAAELGVATDRLLFAAQVHGRDAVEVRGPWGDTGPARADALVCRAPGLAVGVLVADCVPLLLADPRQGVIAAVHAGRPGMMARIVDAAVSAMGDLGAGDLVAVLGPSVCGLCYEVPEQLRDEAAAITPASAALSRAGTPAIDVAAGVVAQLAEHGIPAVRLPGCTRESPDLYSYRRDGRTGRFAGVVRLHDRQLGPAAQWTVRSASTADTGAVAAHSARSGGPRP